MGKKKKKKKMSGVGKKKRTFRKFSFRGYDLEQLLDMSNEDIVGLLNSRQRRRNLQRGRLVKHLDLANKMRKKKQAVPPGERPDPIKTHLRNAIIMPEMVGSIVGIYNGKSFNGVQIMPEMIGHYLGEFSITYKPTRHGRAGVSAAHQMKFIPLS
jgi:small subunit ribosomal protein S15e